MIRPNQKLEHDWTDVCDNGWSLFPRKNGTALACIKRLRIMMGLRERGWQILRAKLSDKCNIVTEGCVRRTA